MRTLGFVIFSLVLALAGITSAQTPLGSAFLYQGTLKDGGVAATGTYDLQVTLFDAPDGGSPVGTPTTVVREDVPVTDGAFLVSLDFGSAAFGASKRWLQLGVRAGASTGAFTVLTPRQEVTPTPTALHAASAQTVAGLACSDGQVLRWSGTAWACGTTASNGAGVTAVTAGAGLAGGTITGTGTLSVAPSGITSAMIAPGAIGPTQVAAGAIGTTQLAAGAVGATQLAAGSVGATQIAAGAVGSTQINTAQVQARVSGACAAGQYVRSIAANGTVTCGTDAINSGTVTSVVAGAGLAGGTITGSGTLSVATGGITSAMLANGAVGAAQINTAQVQARLTSTCGVGQYIQAIGQDGSVTCGGAEPRAGFTTATINEPSFYIAMAIGSDGLPLLAYLNTSTFHLRTAHCANLACTALTAPPVSIDVPQGNNYSGLYPSMAIGKDGLALISYTTYDGQIRIAHCNDVACSTATKDQVDFNVIGRTTSLTIDADGLGIVSYLGAGSTLRIARCTTVLCDAQTYAIIDTAEDGSSITIGSDGLPVVAYTGVSGSSPVLRVVHCNDKPCNLWTASTVDGSFNVGAWPSITLGVDGLPLISYWGAPSNVDLKVARCNNVLCTSATITNFATPESDGWETSATIGTDGLGIIAHHDSSNGDLRITHCTNAVCSTATTTVVDAEGYAGRTASIAIGVDGMPVVAYRGANDQVKILHCNNVACLPTVRRR